MRSFLDTNVLVYTDDHDAPDKQAAAIALTNRLRHTREGVVSTQVLQEYYAVATKKLGVPAFAARSKVELFGRLDLVRIDLDLLLAAIDLQARASLSFWDALVVRAAQASGCSVLYTEDLQHGQRFDSVAVVNPFLA